MTETKIVYNIGTGESPTCCLCECFPNTHMLLWQCPLFQGEMICSECCHVDTLRNDIDSKFSAKLGREISKEEINSVCRDCGRNYAMQDADQAPIDMPSDSKE